MKYIELIECFKTWQGEGPYMGRRVLLCRFQKCQLNCSFCDTMTKMNNNVAALYSIDMIQKNLHESNKNLLITGGEPTLYNNDVSYMIENLDYNICMIETNGYKLDELILRVDETKYNVKYIVSPKVVLTDEMCNVFLNNKNIILKFTVDLYDSKGPTITNKSLDMLYAKNFDMNRLYLMPIGTDINEIRKNFHAVFALANKYNCNITSRMHIVYNFF